MSLLVNTLLWGMIVGVIHFVIVGILYQNPIVSKIYKSFEDHPAVKKWGNHNKYILSMFLGTQVEIFIITLGYIVFSMSLGMDVISTLIIASIFAGIRVYPRFWNMWIQSNYPNKLLIIEIVNGTISTFVIVFSLYFLPI